MAIKEFIIGPQNYWEQGYFDGDYTLPNVSKSFLECDIDNIKGGRVVTGLYYEDDYIDGTYWHDNSIRSEMTVDAMIVQEASVSMQGYYQEGYYVNGYFGTSGGSFILTAELERKGELVSAIGNWSSQSTLTAAAVKSVDSISNISAEFTQSVAISHIEGADLFAFTEAQIAVTVDRIRDNNSAVSGQFDIATDFVRTRSSDADVDSILSAIIDGLRSRDTITETQAAFSISTLADNFKSFDATISAASEFTVTISHIEGADIIAENFATVSAAADRTRDNQSAQISSSSLDSTVSLTKDINATASSSFNVSIIGVKISDLASTQSATVTADISGDRIRFADSAQTANCDLSCTISHIHGADLQAFGNAQLSIDAVKIANAVSDITSNNTVVANITVSYANIPAALKSNFALIPSNYLGTGRPRNWIINTSSTTVANVLSTDFKKFGSYSWTYYNNGSNTVTEIQNEIGFTKPDPNESWVYETYLYRIGSLPIGTIDLANTSFFALQWLGAASNGAARDITLFYSKSGASNTVTIGTAFGSVLPNAWNHFLVVYHSGYLAFYLNGSRLANIDLTARTTSPWVGTGLRNLTIATRQYAYIDETSLHIGTNLGYNPSSTTITVPTSTRTNNSDYTQFLWHYEGNNNDDLKATYSQSASLSSNFTQTSLLSGPVRYTADLTSQFTAVITGSKNSETNLVAFADALVTAQGDRIRGADSAQNAESTQNTVIDRLRDNQSAQSSEFAQSTEAVKTVTATADFTAFNTQLTLGDRSRDVTVAASADTALTAEAVKTVSAEITLSAFNTVLAAGIINVDYTADLNSEFTVAALGDRIRFGQSDQNTEFTQTATANYQISQQAAANSAFTVEATTAGIIGVQSALFAESALATVTDRIRDNQSTQTAQAQVGLDYTRIRDHSSDITSTATVDYNIELIKVSTIDTTAIATELAIAVKTGNTLVDVNVISAVSAQAQITAAGNILAEAVADQNTQAVKTADSQSTQSAESNLVGDGTTNLTGEADLLAEATVNADVNKTAANASLMVVDSTLTCDIGVIRGFAVLTASGGNLTADVSRIRNFNTNFAAISIELVLGTKVITILANLTSTTAMITDGRDIDLRKYVYVIPEETRNWIIQEENRTRVIREETRIFKIRRY